MAGYGQDGFPKIQVIKAVFNLTELGLKESKELVDDLVLAAKKANYLLSHSNCWTPLGICERQGIAGLLCEALSHNKASRTGVMAGLYIEYARARLQRYPSET